MLPEVVADAQDVPADYLLTPLPEGWRVLVLRDDRLRLRSRSGEDLAPWLPSVTVDLARGGRRGASGELSAVDAVLCWPRRADGAWPTLTAVDSVVLLDVLVHEGRDVTARDLHARVALLREFARGAGDSISTAPVWRGSAAAAWAQARGASVAPQAGLLARRPGAPYRPGRRSADWLLLSLETQRELLLCGIAESGALVLGAPTPRGLVFAGTSWPTRRWAELAVRCEEGPRPFPDPGIWPSLGPIAWARPTLWVSVAPDARPSSGAGGPTWRLLHVQEDLSPPEVPRPSLPGSAGDPP
jgi:hypothetical protein